MKTKKLERQILNHSNSNGDGSRIGHNRAKTWTNSSAVQSMAAVPLQPLVQIHVQSCMWQARLWVPRYVEWSSNKL